jgi:hypothetical protein
MWIVCNVRVGKTPFLPGERLRRTSGCLAAETAAKRSIRSSGSGVAAPGFAAGCYPNSIPGYATVPLAQSTPVPDDLAVRRAPH